ncbi:hypothetical protein ACGFX2_37320 [Streptomyces goshikiensis]
MARTTRTSTGTSTRAPWAHAEGNAYVHQYGDTNPYQHWNI